MILETIYWNIGKEIFSFEIPGLGAHLALRWYSLLFALGFVIGFMIMQKIFRYEKKNEKLLDALAITMVVSTIIGARLGHCLFYDPKWYLSHPIEILKVWEGGLASHGGALGILIGLWLFARKHKEISYLWILDRIVITVALAGCFIRLGNFFNSEILGIPANVPWAVVFEQVDQVPRHPVQLYESISYLLIFIFLFSRYFKLKGNIPPGQNLGWFLFLVFGARILWEFFKERQAAFSTHLPLDMGSLLSIPFVIIGIYLIMRIRNKVKLNQAPE